MKDNKFKYRIITSDNKIKFAGTDKPSWLTLEMARNLVDYSKNEMIYEFIIGGEKLWQVF